MPNEPVLREQDDGGRYAPHFLQLGMSVGGSVIIQERGRTYQHKIIWGLKCGCGRSFCRTTDVINTALRRRKVIQCVACREIDRQAVVLDRCDARTGSGGPSRKGLRSSVSGRTGMTATTAGSIPEVEAAGESAGQYIEWENMGTPEELEAIIAPHLASGLPHGHPHAPFHAFIPQRGDHPVSWGEIVNFVWWSTGKKFQQDQLAAFNMGLKGEPLDARLPLIPHVEAVPEFYSKGRDLRGRYS